MAEDPYRYFRIEAHELVEQIGQCVLELEKGPPDPQLVARVLRLVHTLKGAARVVRLPEIADQAHAIEDVLAPLRDSPDPLSADRVTQLLSLVDAARDRVATLPAAGPSARPNVGEHARGAGSVRSTDSAPAPNDAVLAVRADTADTDELLATIGETQTRFEPVRRCTTAVDRARRGVALLADQLATPSVAVGTHAQADAARRRASSITAQIEQDLAALGRELTRIVEHTHRELQQVRACAERLRLVPARALFGPLHRAIRDDAAAQGKRVAFEALGGEVRLDPQVLSAAFSALLHIVRNALAHGIEAEPDRLVAGKPPQGRIVIEVARRERHMAFICRDDGCGFDFEAVREAARARGLPGVDISGLDPRQLVDLLLQGGISTSNTVSPMSGRGIGLDAVREVAERLRGNVAIDTTAGIGTTVELVLPVSLLAIEGLLVEAGDAIVTIPLERVRHSMRLRADEIAGAESAATVRYDGAAIPFLSLAQQLNATSTSPPNPSPSPAFTAVVVAAGAGTLALGVDRVLACADVIVQPLPDLTPAHDVVGGVSLDGRGNPRIVVNVDALSTMAGRTARQRVGSAPVPRRRPVLVVDDSLTTRMLEQSILQSAGYDVDVAASAEEALEKARANPYALFLVDVEMPGMDGFAFIEHTRDDDTLRHIPSILISSRTSPQDRQRGAEVGARLYVAKSEFDQNTLLEHIKDLVG